VILSCSKKTEKNRILKEEFFNKIENNEVKSVTFFSNSDYAEISFYNNKKNKKYTYYNIKDLRSKLNNYQIDINYEEKEKPTQSILSWIASLFFVFSVFVVMIIIFIIGTRYLIKTGKKN
tara:strand:+ start:427 stop:786 length:360 start_codon:yes stop_codon:yes gene_type:complete